MTFKLHPQLDNDTTCIGQFPLCLVLLHRDSCVPWLILVPKVDDLKEFHHLATEQQQQFLLESQLISEMLENEFSADKINLGSLGNLVPQLHYHHIARYKNDLAWPGPIWGNTPGKWRTLTEQQAIEKRIQSVLERAPIFRPQSV
jgi:diadenosine tetraphosphate (Ap4A) HIT family hydrolase